MGKVNLSKLKIKELYELRDDLNAEITARLKPLRQKAVDDFEAVARELGASPEWLLLSMRRKR